MYVHLLILARCELRSVNCTTELFLQPVKLPDQECVCSGSSTVIYSPMHAATCVAGCSYHTQQISIPSGQQRPQQRAVRGATECTECPAKNTLQHTAPPHPHPRNNTASTDGPAARLLIYPAAARPPGKQAGAGVYSTRTPRRQRAGQLGCMNFPRWLRAGCAQTAGGSAGGTAWRGTARTQVGWGTAGGRLRPAAARVPWRRDCPARLLSASALLSVLISLWLYYRWSRDLFI